MQNAIVNVDHEAAWNAYVSHAKKFVKAIQICRTEIAKTAIEATEFKGNGYGRARLYTLERFASEVGIKYKTLLEYVRVYKNVTSKLPDDMRDGKNFEALRRVSQLTDSRSAPAKVVKLFAKELARDKQNEYFAQYLKRVRNLRHLICQKADLNKLDPAELAELAEICQQIIQKIEARTC